VRDGPSLRNGKCRVLENGWHKEAQGDKSIYLGRTLRQGRGARAARNEAMASSTGKRSPTMKSSGRLSRKGEKRGGGFRLVVLGPGRWGLVERVTLTSETRSRAGL